jgi:hypothetical protein
VVAAVCAVVADEGAVAEQQQVGVRVEQGAARVTAEAVNVPSVPGCRGSVCAGGSGQAGGRGDVPSSKALPSSSISPQPLHG